MIFGEGLKKCGLAGPDVALDDDRVRPRTVELTGNRVKTAPDICRNFVGRLGRYNTTQDVLKISSDRHYEEEETTFKFFLSFFVREKKLRQ
jgi:hypothetical protein